MEVRSRVIKFGKQSANLPIKFYNPYVAVSCTEEETIWKIPKQ